MHNLTSRSSVVVMKILGLQLIFGDFLARSVRGIPCAPPAEK